MAQHLAVFDGSTAFIIPNDEYLQYLEVIGESNDIDEAQEIADNYNVEHKLL